MTWKYSNILGILTRDKRKKMIFLNIWVELMVYHFTDFNLLSLTKEGSKKKSLRRLIWGCPLPRGISFFAQRYIRIISCLLFIFYCLYLVYTCFWFCVWPLNLFRCLNSSLLLSAVCLYDMWYVFLLSVFLLLPLLKTWGI